MLAGIYKIENLATKDFYIGSSQDLYKRIGAHIRKLSRGKHINPILQNSFNKYGEQYFEFTILLVCEIESLLYYEQLLIDKLNPGYNIAKIAGAPMRGTTVSEVIKEKIRAANLGKIRSLEEREKISHGQIGIVHYVKTYYNLQSPDGIIFKEITNLAKFCREHGVESKHMVQLFSNKVKARKTHKGWKLAEGVI